MCLINDDIQQPWTDVTQTIAAIIGLIATIIGVYVLLRRDKDKEEQIKKLGDIAGQLNRMLADSEKRYVQTRKPVLDIDGTYLKTRKEIILKFTNFNPTSQVLSYEPIDLDRKLFNIIVDNLTSTHQEFGVMLHYKESVDEFQVIEMKYVMSEGYMFYQILRIGIDHGPTLGVFQDPILEKPFSEREF
ncbi:hypothetical protein D3C87_513600 [compost metagenome]